MNLKYKQLLMGLLLLMLQPVAIANIHYYNNYVQNYSNCAVQLLDDNSIKVSFQVNLVDGLFGLAGGGHRIQWGKLINTPDEGLKNTSLSSHKAILSLYFYNVDGTRNLNINIKDIHDIYVNGLSHNNSSNNIQEIKFTSKTPELSRTQYYISFTVNANVLKNIRIGASVGGELISGKQQYSLISSKGVSFNSTGNQCNPFDPQANIAPQSLIVEPKFRLTSPTWQLKNIDLDHLLNNSTETQGLRALMGRNTPAIRFCIGYRAMGVQNNRYMISASNINGLASNRFFQLKEKQGHNLINYKVRLHNNENTQDSFSLPKERKFIQLKTDNFLGEEQMCWSPRIRLYRTSTTDKGSYSDTLNFTITPQA